MTSMTRNKLIDMLARQQLQRYKTLPNFTAERAMTGAEAIVALMDDNAIALVLSQLENILEGTETPGQAEVESGS